ncbi:MAG: haloalkane dehalogenase [Bacteroidota bacterium]
MKYTITLFFHSWLFITWMFGQSMTNQQIMTTSSIDRSTISADFEFESKFQSVQGSNIHYIDEGPKSAQHTFVLLHGNPTSNYIWRNIVPHLTPHGRVVAPDLIGMGKSDKPDIAYTFQDHIDHIDGFIQALELENIILVIQDWGSGIGFHFAHRHPEKVAGIVLFEAIIRTIEWKDANIIERYIFKRMRHPEKGHKMNVKKNFFIEKFLPMMTKRKLTEQEKAYYASPYLKEVDRKAVAVWPTQIPISGEPAANHQIVKAYENWLPNSPMPKLLFHAKPGMIIKPKEAKKIIATWNNLESIDLGKGKHYLQETYPHEIGAGIVNWYLKQIKH